MTSDYCHRLLKVTQLIRVNSTFICVRLKGHGFSTAKIGEKLVFAMQIGSVVEGYYFFWDN